MYYTVIKPSSHLRTLEKCRKHSPAARAFYISLVFSNACRVLSQCNTRLRLLYLLSKFSLLAPPLRQQLVLVLSPHRVNRNMIFNQSVRAMVPNALKQIIIFFSICTLSDLGVLSDLIGSLSLANEHYWPQAKQKQNGRCKLAFHQCFGIDFFMVSFWKCCWDHWVCGFAAR